jgi:DNA-directed RNA polymerase subunit RPC12/RpoP
MAIPVECSCGRSFRVADKLAGRTGRCPDCGNTIKIPRPLSHADCFCGYRITFAPERAGETIHCDSCGRQVMLTDPDLLPEVEIETEAPDTSPRCPSCMARIMDVELVTCPECGASLRSGRINYRASMPKAQRILRPQFARGGVPVAHVRVKLPEPEPPPPAAMPHIDSSHVEWQDSPQAQQAEALADSLGSLGQQLDLSPGSLAILEFVLEQRRESGEGLLAKFLDQVAAYIGEVVTRNLGGRWRRTKDGRLVVAHLPGGRTFDPAGQLRRHLAQPPGGDEKHTTLVQLFLQLARTLELL